jgi:hypothetical protein
VTSVAAPQVFTDEAGNTGENLSAVMAVHKPWMFAAKLVDELIESRSRRGFW